MRFEMKKPIAILITAVFLLSALSAIGLTTIPAVSAADPTNWYMTKTGVLSDDYYTLYPFETDASLKIGFSKFGEMIDSNTNTGLEYRDADPFAPAAGAALISEVPKNLWLNGWMINITYFHRTLGWRNVWAGALHSDSFKFGGDWIRVDYTDDYDSMDRPETFKLAGYNIYGTGYGSTLTYGGRKTNGTAYSWPIEVLFDGPRELVAVTRTIIYDHPLWGDNSTESDVPLVEIAITFVWNKDKKEINLLKDVKSLLPRKEGENMKIQFGDRGEVDLGDPSAQIGYSSFAHFYTEGISTAYDPIAQATVVDDAVEGMYTPYNDQWVLTTSEDPEAEIGTFYEGYSAAGPYPQAGDATFDVAQAINPDANDGNGLVWWAGFWPSLSDWTIDGWDQWWHTMTADDPHYVDALPKETEPFVPFYIGEWDFILWNTNDAEGRLQFRGVTQYGLSDLHDGDDAQISEGSNVIDREAWYFLEEKFDPWDLNDVVNKDTFRHVEFIDTDWIDLGPDAVWETSFYQYAGFPERVEDLGTGELLYRDIDYTLVSNETSVYLIDIDGSGEYKVTWSTYVGHTDEGFDGRWEWIVVGRDAASVDSAGAALIAANSWMSDLEIGIAGEDMRDPEVANQIPDIMAKLGTGDSMSAYKDAAKTGLESPGLRSALKDDWCTYWPITTSNIISVGGPLANVLAYYANDLMPAVYGIPQFSGAAYSNKLAPIPCWNRAWAGTYNTYESDTTTGYATIQTVIDMNGTVIFEVYGLWGRDTFYASQWIYGDAERGISPGLFWAYAAPDGLTSIILQIDYTDPKHPDFTIVEALGTISEHALFDQFSAGIHDP